MITGARDRAPCETGGLLVGYWAQSGSEVVITEATLPGPNAIETTDSFTPDYDFDRELIARRFISSDERYTYLGDWHSHPEGEIYLSPDDLQALRVIGETPAAKAGRPLMIVVGGEESSGLGAWIWLGVKGALFWKRNIVEAVPLRVV
jgi:integrative and conjugative element protein (TIGR02256 family)